MSRHEMPSPLIPSLTQLSLLLDFLKTQWVAPLGSIALIFNFIFAKILVGTRIIKQDVWGTIVVMISVIWIVVFGGMNSSSADVEETLTLPELKALFSRPVFIIYFSILNIVIAIFLIMGQYAFWVITIDDQSGQLRKNMKKRLTKLLGTNRCTRASGLTLESDEGPRAEACDMRMKKVIAMIMSACGGLLASETLLLAKSGVKLITSSANGHNQFQDSLSYVILCILLLAAILQVKKRNSGGRRERTKPLDKRTQRKTTLFVQKIGVLLEYGAQDLRLGAGGPNLLRILYGIRTHQLDHLPESAPKLPALGPGNDSPRYWHLDLRRPYAQRP